METGNLSPLSEFPQVSWFPYVHRTLCDLVSRTGPLILYLISVIGFSLSIENRLTSASQAGTSPLARMWKVETGPKHPLEPDNRSSISLFHLDPYSFSPPRTAFYTFKSPAAYPPRVDVEAP